MSNHDESADIPAAPWHCLQPVCSVKEYTQ